MRVSYTPRAVRDLSDIGSYLLERNPTGAARVARRILAVVDLVAAFPSSGRAVSSRPNVRVIPLGSYPYLIFYTTRGEELFVLHIRHAAMKPPHPDEI